MNAREIFKLAKKKQIEKTKLKSSRKFILVEFNPRENALGVLKKMSKMSKELKPFLGV